MMTRIKVGTAALLVLVLASSAFLALRWRTADQLRAVSDVAPVEEESQRLPGDAASTVNRAQSKSTASENTATWSAEAEEALNMGIELAPGQTLLDHFIALERRVAAGDTQAMLQLAKLLQDCRHSEDALGNEQSSLRERARLCLGLPERDIDYGSELVAEAARNGDEEAIYEEYGYAPVAAWAMPRSETAKKWFHGVVGRLVASAERGNAAAAFRLGHVYTSNTYGPQDLQKAVIYYRRSLELSQRVELGPHLQHLTHAQLAEVMRKRYRWTSANSKLTFLCSRVDKSALPSGICH